MNVLILGISQTDLLVVDHCIRVVLELSCQLSNWSLWCYSFLNIFHIFLLIKKGPMGTSTQGGQEVLLYRAFQQNTSTGIELRSLGQHTATPTTGHCHLINNWCRNVQIIWVCSATVIYQPQICTSWFFTFWQSTLRVDLPCSWGQVSTTK